MDSGHDEEAVKYNKRKELIVYGNWRKMAKKSNNRNYYMIIGLLKMMFNYSFANKMGLKLTRIGNQELNENNGYRSKIILKGVKYQNKFIEINTDTMDALLFKNSKMVILKWELKIVSLKQMKFSIGFRPQSNSNDFQESHDLHVDKYRFMDDINGDKLITIKLMLKNSRTTYIPEWERDGEDLIQGGELEIDSGDACIYKKKIKRSVIALKPHTKEMVEKVYRNFYVVIQMIKTTNYPTKISVINYTEIFQ